MELSIVYDREIDGNIEDLIRASGELGHKATLVSINKISAALGPSSRFWVKGKILRDLDACLLRSIGSGSYELMCRRIDLLEQMELSGILVINPVNAFRRAKDKYAALYALANSGIKIPRTIVTESSVFAYHFFKTRVPFVYKPLTGSMGYGSSKFDDVDVAYNVLHLLERSGRPLYLQEYLKTNGTDIRAFVIGGKVVAAIERRAMRGSWKTNIAQGGKALKKALSADLAEAAIKACEVLGLEYGGVDLVDTSRGPYVLEVNSSPSWKGLRAATEIDVAKLLVNHVESKLKR